MIQDEKELEAALLVEVMQLNAVVSGLVTGLLAGLGLLVATLYLVVKGGEVVGPHLSLLGQYFPGYSVTVMGSLVGFVYAFIVGFAIAYLVATLYNWLSGLRIGRRHNSQVTR